MESLFRANNRRPSIGDRTPGAQGRDQDLLRPSWRFSSGTTRIPEKLRQSEVRHRNRHFQECPCGPATLGHVARAAESRRSRRQPATCSAAIRRQHDSHRFYLRRHLPGVSRVAIRFWVAVVNHRFRGRFHSETWSTPWRRTCRRSDFRNPTEKDCDQRYRHLLFRIAAEFQPEKRAL